MTDRIEAIKAVMTALVEYTEPDRDLVCKECRGRGDHLSICSQKDEPWPVVTHRREPTLDEAAQAADAACLEALMEPTEEMLFAGSEHMAQSEFIEPDGIFFAMIKTAGEGK